MWKVREAELGKVFVGNEFIQCGWSTNVHVCSVGNVLPHLFT